MTRLLILTILLLPFTLSAQEEPAETGILTGRVLNAVTAEPLPVATVQIVGTSLGAAADPGGAFTIRGIPVGTYQVRASLVGFQPQVVTDVVIRSGRPRDLSIALEETAIAIDGVDVTASFFRPSADAPVSLQRLSAEEIRRAPGGLEDVLRAVSVLPGVGQPESGRNDLIVRGGAPSENIFVVDGLEIPNINHFGTQGASGGPLSYINLDFVRETAFSTGGFGVKNGDRMSSVLNIDLIDGRTDRWGGKGTISATQFGLNAEGPVGTDGSLILSVRRSYLDFIFKAADFNFVPEYWDFLARGATTVDRNNRITVLGVGALNDVRFFNTTAEDRFDNSRILGTDQQQAAGGVTWQHLFSGGFVTFAAGHSYVRYNSLQRDSLLNPVFTNLSTENETNLRADLVWQADEETEISAGAQVKPVRFTSDISLPGYESTFGDSLGFDRREVEATGLKGAVYAQAVRHFFDERLHLTTGVRADYFDLLDRRTVVSPRGALRFQLTASTAVAGSIGMYTQAPSYIWLTNPNNSVLEPARARQVVLGVEHLLRPDLKARLEVYDKRYTRYPASLQRTYLVLANTGAGFGGSDESYASFGLDDLVSEGTGRSQGVELLLQKKLSDIPLYGILSVTVGRSRFTALDGVERAGSFDQPVLVALSVGYRFDERWEASARFRYGSGRPYTPFNADGSQDPERYNSERLAARHSLDLRVDRRWNFSAWNLIVYLDIQNIYGFKEQSGVRWNAREQRAETDESAIGVLPSIGVSAEF